MRFFSDKVLAQAVALRAETIELPSWLESARNAFIEFHAPGGGNALDFAARLASIGDWPERAEDRDAALDRAAQPLRELMAKAFFKLETDENGQETARLLSGASRARAKSGALEFEFLEDDTLHRPAKDLFKYASWDGVIKKQEVLSWGSVLSQHLNDFIGINTNPGDIEEKDRAIKELTERPSGPQEQEEKEFKQKALSLASRRDSPAEIPERMISEAVGRGILGLDVSQRAYDDFWRVDRLKRLSDPESEKISAYFNSEESAISFRWVTSASREMEEETGVESEKPASLETDVTFLGLSRATELNEALETLGALALEGARADAQAALLSFIERVEPGSDAAVKMAESIWGVSLSIEAASSARSWLPMATRLMQEDPRRAKLALLVAPDLGVVPDLDLLSKVKADLKGMGLPEAVWKDIGALPSEDFVLALKEFESAATTGSKREKSGLHFFSGSSDGDKPFLAADPFGPKKEKTDDLSGEAPGRKHVQEAALRLAVISEAARLAGVSMSQSISFCLADRPAMSAGWSEITKKLRSEGAQDDMVLSIGLRFKSRRMLRLCCPATSSHEEIDFHGLPGVGVRRERPEADPMSDEAKAKEADAVRLKGPKVLALAMKEATRRPMGEVFDELDDLADWISRSEPGLWQQLPEGMSWASLRRREAAWHREIKASTDPDFATPWPVVLAEGVRHEGLSAGELRSGADLFEEGKAMRHCVSTYAQDCRDGEARIYSIQDASGKRLATLEASVKAGADGQLKASVAQLRGSSNRPIKEPSIHALCKKVIDEMNQRFEAAPSHPIQGKGVVLQSQGLGVRAALRARRQALEAPEEPRVAAAHGPRG